MRGIAGIAVAIAAVTLLAGAARAGEAESLDVNVLGLFPKNVAELGYADLKDARELPWFAQFRQQALPSAFMDFEQGLKGVGVDPKQIESVAWALGTANEKDAKHEAPDKTDVMGVATGEFSPTAVSAYYEMKKLPTVTVSGYTLYSCSSCGDGLYFFFVDPETLAFGQAKALGRMIAVHDGAAESLLGNDAAMAAVRSVNGDGIFWGLLNGAGARQALREMAPEAATFPQSDKLLERVKRMVVSVEDDSRVDAKIRVESDSAEAALVLSQLLQAGLLVRSHAAEDGNAGLAKVLDGVTVKPQGMALEVSVTLSDEEMGDLVVRNLFGVRL